MKNLLYLIIIAFLTISCNKREVRKDIFNEETSVNTTAKNIQGVYKYGRYGTAIIIQQNSNLEIFCNYYDRKKNKKSAFKIEGVVDDKVINGVLSEIYPLSNKKYDITGLIKLKPFEISFRNNDAKSTKYKNLKLKG